MANESIFPDLLSFLGKPPIDQPINGYSPVQTPSAPVPPLQSGQPQRCIAWRRDSPLSE